MPFHQHGNSMLVSQTSFCGENRGGVIECWLFSQARTLQIRAIYTITEIYQWIKLLDWNCIHPSMTLVILILYTWAFNYYTFKYHEHMQTTLTIFYRKLNIKKMELPVNRKYNLLNQRIIQRFSGYAWPKTPLKASSLRTCDIRKQLRFFPGQSLNIAERYNNCRPAAILDPTFMSINNCGVTIQMKPFQ